MEKGQFSEALQSLHDYGQHIVAAADIVHQLKFKDYKDNLPSDITSMATNPFHYLTTILVLVGIAIVIYIVYIKCIKNRKNNLPYPSAPAYPMHPLNPIIIARTQV